MLYNMAGSIVSPPGVQLHTRLVDGQTESPTSLAVLNF